MEPLDPGALAPTVTSQTELDDLVVRCDACPRLVAWREQVARDRRRAYADQTYWGRPVPSFGAEDASLAIVGLAPAAHGGNRTGRMFTGDRAGDVLYAAMYEVGLATAPTATARDDGLRLIGTRITAPVHCAPPENKPTPAERDRCGSWLRRELELLRPTLRAVVVLGGFAWQAVFPILADTRWKVPVPRPRFGHGARVRLPASDDGPDLAVFGCFHVSQRNTFTGRLTPAVLRSVLAAAGRAAGLPTVDGEGSSRPTRR
ncbi:uracil-DNA glycosylase [Actinoalloteichus hymeniacidonis]|uniref:uracil-DNA glycosylase n=1 Tax=Actinoalloteichus hymeniacidonis TaxID=340345 RepID=UPI000853E646|nr:uracil-DNA glycosylase [Actinoalloteichus hymeniacidonis]MBB5910399.1 uracil-DNA glycosylase family 4 [Actinoalloteichus hymeniacidonis]